MLAMHSAVRFSHVAYFMQLVTKKINGLIDHL